MMADESTPGDVAASNPDTDEQTGDGGEQKKRRRRKRGGRNRRGKSDGQQQENGEGGSSSEPESGVEETTEAKPKRKSGGRRRSSGKKGHRKDDADEATKEPAPSDAGPEKGEEDKSKRSDVFADIPFEELGLRNSVMKGVNAAGYERATFIQSQLIPAVLEGKDVLGQAKTGSGKTAAFGLPLFHLARRNLPFQTIVLCPTRELAIQIARDLTDFGQFTPIKVCAVYGGQPINTQVKKLEKNPEIIVATPGRLVDLIERRKLHYDNVRFIVLDEVDRMLDIGFRDEIRRILKSIKTEHQTIFVSATISEEIENLARTFMKDNVEKIVTTAGSLTVDVVEQHYLSVNRWDKKRLLLHLLTHEEPALTLVFCRTKRMVDDLAAFLKKNDIDAYAIHGDMHQGQRNRVMDRLRTGKLAVVVASDLAARGLDVDDISHVVNYDLPEDPEIYIHRIGRTARAGREGVAWSLVTPEEGNLLTGVEKLANIEIPKMDYPDFKPGPVPDNVRVEREKLEKSREQTAAQNRYNNPSLPGRKADTDAHRFPGGLVPKKMPPRRMGGKVSTGRGSRPIVPPDEEPDKS